MNNTLLSGASPNGIRPKDETGKDVDDVEIAITEVLDVDGTEYEIQKTQTQNWNKKQGTLIGNTNSYMVNGIPKKEKEFKQFLQEHIVPDDVYQYCTSASAFLRLDSKKRREKLFSLIPEFTEDDVLAVYPDLFPVKPLLLQGTVEELIARCKYQLHGRGRGDKGLEGQLDDIPIRIDEANRSIVDESALDMEAAGIETEIMSMKSRLEALQSGDDGTKTEAARIKAAMKTLADNALSELTQKRSSALMEVREASNTVDNLKRSVGFDENELRNLESSVERMKTRIQGYADMWIRVKNMVFDEKKKICSYCGQPLPDDQVEKLVAVFEQNKANELANIEQSGNDTKKNVIEANNRIEELKKKIAREKTELEIAENMLALKERDLKALPEYVSMLDNAEYCKLDESYNALMARAIRPDTTEADSLNSEIRHRQNRLNEIQSEKIASERAKTRIMMLEDERKKISMRIAEIQKELDMLMEYNRRRGEIITNRINSLFEFIEWDLFDFTIKDGNYSEICEPKYQGVRYSQLLNGGAKILTEADIVNTFQKQNGVSLPVFLDNAEAITEETRNKFNRFDFQTIFLEVAESDFTVKGW